MRRENLSPRWQLLVALALVAVASSTAASSPAAVPTATPAAARSAALLAQDGLTIDQLLAIRYPSSPLWSPVGGRVAFLWEGDGSLDLWWTAEGLEEPVTVTGVAAGTPHAVAGFDWTTDGAALVYSLGGDLFLHRTDRGQTEALTTSEESDTGPVMSPDGGRLAFVRDGRPWVVSFPDMQGGPVAEQDGAFRSLQWSADGRHLAALHGRDELFVEDAGQLVGSKMQFSRRQGTPADLVVIDLVESRLFWLERGDAYAGAADLAADGRIAWQEVSHDAKRRRILVAEAPEWSPRVLVEEVDEAWWTLTYLDAGPQWEPAGDRLVYISERDGWAHLYLLDAARPDDDPVQLTHGEFEVEAPAWSPDGGRLVLSANQGSRTERGLHLIEVPEDAEAAEIPEMEPISRLRGTSTGARWRPDGSRLLFLHADNENPLDLWLQDPAPMVADQLTESWPPDADESELIAPQTVRFSSSDGELVPAQLFLPPGYEDLEQPLPAIVWAHGGGIRQNRYGWHPLRAYSVFYGFHQYLLQRGYVVVTVDYRGSIGYGREFRQGQYLDLGGGDLEDVLSAIRYLRRVDDIEIGRIGVWGISYGGFLTLHALTQAPTAFDAGINVAGVADWADWAVDPGGLWIEGRMGSAQANAEIYRRSSPIHFVDRVSRPLLTLHGTADSSVPVLQAFRLTDALIRAGKRPEVMFYPGEQHVFVRDAAWRDAFQRVESFFDRTLRR